MNELTSTLSCLALLAGAVACQTFDPPPQVWIARSENGTMRDTPEQPLELVFSEPYRASSLRMKVVPAEFDAEGNLLDEQHPAKPTEFSESIVVAYDGARPDDPERSFGASFERFTDRLVVRQDDPFAWAAPYLVLIEPGLEDLDGNATLPRKRLPFTYGLTSGGPNSLPTGYYYFLMNVEFLATQIQVYAYLDVDPVSGDWRAIFTNGNRLLALNKRPGCPDSCPTDEPICALFPNVRCAKPSEKQGSLAEFRDFLPEPDPPDGYTFIADGFARDEADGSIALGTKPFLIDIVIGQGGINVRAEGTTVNGAFRRDPKQPTRWIASGSLGVEVVKINNAGNSTTKGEFTAMTLEPSEVIEIESFDYPIPTNLY
jgi:hypothetical protein